MPSDEGLFDRGDSAISDVDSRGDGIDILVIPDAHAQPGVDNERFSLLGRMICDVRPDVVVSIGDLFDLPSLSSYNVGRKSFEGRTYADDIDAGLEAQELLFGEVEKYNRRRSNPVKPEWHYCLGNHEQREPGTAAFAHVRTARRNVARLYRRLLLPWCDEFEDNWVAFKRLDREPPTPS